MLESERLILKELEDAKTNHEYLPITGLDAFVKGASALVFGDKLGRDGRVQGVQALSGTGALRLGATLIGDNFGDKPLVYLSDPTWSNHVKIFTKCGCRTVSYRYYDAKTRGFDCAGMLADLDAAPKGSVVLLHACAHNPTGVDPSPEQWKKICDVVLKRGLFPYFDIAYQGFATGSLESDAFAIRHFAERGASLFVAQSFAKNFGLYNERAGCLQILAPTEAEAKAVKSQVALIVRAMYSNPPNHGARIVATTLNTPRLRKQWESELRIMSGRIIEMRAALVDALKAKNTPGSWRHVTDQIGMFSYTGLTPEQVAYIEKNHHVYMLSTGRISMAGINKSNVQHVANAIYDAVTNCKA